jgi:putative nucleotidyltransferase with HDIG domain
MAGSSRRAFAAVLQYEPQPVILGFFTIGLVGALGIGSNHSALEWHLPILVLGPSLFIWIARRLKYRLPARVLLAAVSIGIVLMVAPSIAVLGALSVGTALAGLLFMNRGGDVQEHLVSLGGPLASLSTAFGSQDDNELSHCRRVASNACALGLFLGLTDDEMTVLRWAALLHDVGKTRVPSEVLLKPGPLSVEEMELVRAHSQLGAEIVLGLGPENDAVATAILGHHERWDGNGYPSGLSGEAISLQARIISVVDVFEALTSERPYRRASDPEDALALLRAGAGSHFDPRLVEVFEVIYQRGDVQTHSRPAESGTVLAGVSSASSPRSEVGIASLLNV